MPQDPAAQLMPILRVAASLGMPVQGRHASCYNSIAHKKGTDKCPSLAFFPDSNTYKCFACGVRGDAITLVRTVKELSFQKAKDYLKALSSSSLSQPYSGETTPTPRSKEVYQRLHDLSAPPSETTPGGLYLLGRKISLKVAQRCHVREMIDPGAVWQQLQMNFTNVELQAAGLVSTKGNYLFFYHPLLFFYVQGGKPQYVMARDIRKPHPLVKGNGVQKNQPPKELALAKVKPPVPYLVDLLNDSPHEVLLCEGNIDALSAIQLGRKALGVPGATGFRKEWFDLFLKVSHVTIVFDNDEAGRRQASELRAQFRMRGISADTKVPSQGNDINDILKSIS